MTTQLLLPRVGAQKLASRFKDCDNQFIAAVISATIACPPLSSNLIIGGTSRFHTSDSNASVNNLTNLLSSMSVTLKCDLGNRSRTTAFSAAQPALQAQCQLLPVASLPTSHNSPTVTQNAWCSCKYLLGSRLGHPTSRAATASSACATGNAGSTLRDWRKPRSCQLHTSSSHPALSSSSCPAGRLLLRGRTTGGAQMGPGAAPITSSTLATSESQFILASSFDRCAATVASSGKPSVGHVLTSRRAVRGKAPILGRHGNSSAASSYSNLPGTIRSHSSCSSDTSSITTSYVNGIGFRNGTGPRGLLVTHSCNHSHSYSRLGRSGAGRCFANASWGPGGGSGGGAADGSGSGLPPPIIISPVACRVVVIGWMGSNRRYLNKYGSLWARSGDHEVLIIRPSVAQTLVRWRGVVVAGRDIDRVARLHRENPAMPTIYHIFSTGGFIHAGTMWRWMDEVEDVAQRRDMLEEVRGIILDSAPAAVNPEMSARAIVSAITHTPAEELSYGMPGWQSALLDGTRAFMQRYLQSKGVKIRTEEVYDAWYNLAPVCPQLYLYSDADPLVPSSGVERYMGVQEGRGVEVSGYKWPDSGHVEHFRRHPHEYAYQISTFLTRSLRDW